MADDACTVEEIQLEGSATLGGRIEASRMRIGLNIKQLALRLGVMPKTVKNWETDRSEPRANVVLLLAGILRVPAVWLISGESTDQFSGHSTDFIETANLAERIQQLISQHEQTSTLIFALEKEVRSLQNRLDDVVEKSDSIERAASEF